MNHQFTAIFEMQKLKVYYRESFLMQDLEETIQLEAGTKSIVCDPTQLKVGEMLDTPICVYRANNYQLLLRAGTTITADTISQLHRRTETLFFIDPQQHEQSNTQKKVESDEKSDTLKVSRKQKQEGSYSSNLIKKSHEKYQTALEEAEELFQALSSNEQIDAQQLFSAATHSVLEMLDDVDLFVSQALVNQTDNFLHTQAVQISRLAISVGAIMGLTDDELVELCIGCLIHDVGMLKVEGRIYESNRILSPTEFLEITKHPSYTFDAIKDVIGLPTGSHLVAYQLHERWDGSGYPRKTQGDRIYHLARIAAVVEKFVSKISTRPYRPSMSPYEAMQEVICGGASGLFEPESVEGLLNTISLYPIGSYIEMNDRRIGKVIRANYGLHARPVIEIFDPQNIRDGIEIIDLSCEPKLSIKCAR